MIYQHAVYPYTSLISTIQNSAMLYIEIAAKSIQTLHAGYAYTIIISTIQNSAMLYIEIAAKSIQTLHAGCFNLK